MKKVVALLLAVLMLAGFAACGKKEAAAPAAPATDTKSETKTEAKSELPFAGTTLRVILATHDWTKAVEKKLPEFEAATGMKVEYEVYPEGQLSDKLNVELGSGGQYIDVFMCRPLQEVQQFIQNGFLAEVSDLLADPEYQKDDFIPAALNGYARNGANDGKFYGVPLVTERQVLMYRKDLFEAKGLKVPTNLEEFEECAKALHDPDNGVVGVALRGKPNPAVTQFAAYLYGFEYYGGLLRNYGPTDAVNMHWNECAALFSTGGAAMVTDADSIWASFCGPDTQVYDKTGFAVSPNRATWNICAWGLGISANSPHLEAAKAFMKWAAGVEMTKYIQTSGISSARTSAWADPACTANYPAELLAAIQEGNKIATKAYDRPMTTSVAAARDVIGVVITTSIEGGDVQAAADKANEEFQKILDEDAAAK